MSTPFSMNSFEGKRLLALVRDGDFAHAGEVEAIELTMKDIPKDPDRSLLDAGCGRGGTAAYLQQQGWGKVTGFDVEAQSIERARKTYPDVTFLTCDIVAADDRLSGDFHLVTLFNVLHGLPDQTGALRSLSRRTVRDGRLIIFDYVDRGGYRDAPIMEGDEPFFIRVPLYSELSGLLAASGWELEGVEDIDDHYERWYTDLVTRIEDRRTDIESLSGTAGYDHIHGLYSSLLAAIRDRRMGGAIILGRRADRTGMPT